MSAAGRVLAPEGRTFVQPDTGARITRLTGAAAMHHQLYFTTPSWPDAMDCLYLVSYRTGYPNLFRYDEIDHTLTQVTDRVDVNAFSAAVARDGSALYFSARDTVWRVDPATFEETPVAPFRGAKLGNCSLDPAGARLAIGCRYEGFCELCLIRTDGTGHDVVVRQDDVGHVTFRPTDPDLLLFSGPPSQRMWLVRTDGTELRPLYEQPPDEWIVHESWLGNGAEVIFTHWPHALRGISPETGRVRTIANFNAWHACSNREGTQVVCDTARPDRGLRLIDPTTGEQRLLCHPHASCQGTQWRLNVPAQGAGIDVSILRGDPPEADPPPTPRVPEGVYGPQWTHPHPSFSPDGARVVYTSDGGGGWSQVYVVEILPP